jgi:hypothetical protein
LREFIDLTEYEKDTEVVTTLERDSLSEFCRSERESGATGQDARCAAKTSPIACRGLDARLIGGERLPEPAGLATPVWCFHEGYKPFLDPEGRVNIQDGELGGLIGGERL